MAKIQITLYATMEDAIPTSTKRADGMYYHDYIREMELEIDLMMSITPDEESVIDEVVIRPSIKAHEGAFDEYLYQMGMKALTEKAENAYDQAMESKGDAMRERQAGIAP